MRTHFPGTLSQVRPATRFPLNFGDAWIDIIEIEDERRASKRRWQQVSEGESQDGFVVPLQFLITF